MISTSTLESKFSQFGITMASSSGIPTGDERKLITYYFTRGYEYEVHF